jgi:hypothetical protein
VANVLSDCRAEALPLHTRTLSVIVSRGTGDLWHARGDVIDLRKNGCVPSVDDVQPAGIIHMMKIELDFEPETLRMDRIEVDQPFVAVEASQATGGECCRDPVPRLLALRGDRLDAGFTRRLGAAFGGSLGCSHLLTLFQLMASTVPHAMARERERAAHEGTASAKGTRVFRRSIYVDGSMRRDGALDVAMQLADIHTRPPVPDQRGIERLARSHEVKCFAEVERTRFRIERLEVRERSRDLDADEPWTRHDALVAPLVGNPVMPGMAARIFELFDPGEARAPLQDCLLQLAPGFIQIMAALMEYPIRRPSPEARAKEPATPSVAGIGGMPDSCYIWRRDSPYTLSRRQAMLPRDEA